jgi:phage tail-like protein
MPVDKFKVPGTSFHVGLQIEGIEIASFTKVSGLNSESEIIEEKVATSKGQDYSRRFPGRIKVSDINLERGLTNDMTITNWRKQIEDGKYEEALKNGSVVMYDQQHNEVARWNFENAWPSKLEGPQGDATSNALAVEKLTIVPEACKRVS